MKMFSTAKLWIAGIGSALIAGLVLYMKLLKKQRDDARRSRDILLAGRRSNRKKERIIKEEEIKQVSRRAQLLREIKENNDEEPFDGVDILNNPNRVRDDKDIH